MPLNWALSPVTLGLPALWDRLAAGDPGLLRLTLAARGTLSVTLATIVAILIGHYTGISPIEFASGVTLSLMAPFLMREPTRRQRQRTLLLLTLPAAAITIATALLHGRGIAGDASFLILVFACFLFLPRNPRMIGVGLVAIVQAYVGLYLELPPETLHLQLASIVLSVPVVALASFVLIPMNAVGTLRRTVKAVQWRAGQVLRTARELKKNDGPASIQALRHLRRDLVRLKEAALAADDQLALMQPDGASALRTGLIDLELATSRLIQTLRLEGPEIRSIARHEARLALHARRMGRGRRYVMPPEQLEKGSLLAQLVALGHIVHRVGLSAKSLVAAKETAPGTGLPPGPLAWRMATRATLASALAMAGGMALSPQRWFWAVITVYVVFLGARSRGDTMYKGVQRLGGTLLGIASGLVLASLLHGNKGLEIAVLLLSIFGMFYYFLVSYTLGIFCVTIMLGLLYGMFGQPLESLLMLRLEETAIGTAAAVFVSFFVLPTRTRDAVMKSGRGVLTALSDAVKASRETLAGDVAAPALSPAAAMRKVDRQVADLRLALAPIRATRTLFRRTSLERPVPALIECVHWAWMLADAVQAASPEERSALAEQAARIETRLAKLAALDITAAAEAPPPRSDETPSEVKTLLDRLEMSVATLGERVRVGALEGFALDN